MAFSDVPGRNISLRIELEPVYNALNSFSWLTGAKQLAGFNTWIIRTAETLTAERRPTNRLVFEGLRDALVPPEESMDFPAYLNQLAGQEPDLLRDQVLERLRTRFAQRVSVEGSLEAPTIARLLDDVEAYLTCVEYVQTDMPFDAQIQREVHALLHDPAALHYLLLSHLEHLWKTTFATEWQRVQSALRQQIKMFTRGLEEDLSIEQTFHMLTGRDLPLDLSARLAERAELTLVPSWHMGRHLALWEDEHGARLFFSEPPNYDVALLRATPVGRGELRARLSALADETRLRILDLLMQRDEMLAQDIIAALDLSQSSVSRHLKQLASMGYLYESRGEGANKTYRISSAFFARTAHAIEQLVSSERVQNSGEALDQVERPQELQRFLDKSGKLTLWPPARQRDKLLILEYLASFFEPDRVYNEKEVNALLLLHSTTRDSAALRRALYEYRFMNRLPDGSRYWLTGSELSQEEPVESL